MQMNKTSWTYRTAYNLIYPEYLMYNSNIALKKEQINSEVKLNNYTKQYINLSFIGGGLNLSTFFSFIPAHSTFGTPCTKIFYFFLLKAKISSYEP